MRSPLEHPLVRAGIADRRLHHHHAFHVLVQLVEILPADYGFQAVYQASIGMSLHIDRKTVRRAMRSLVRRRYLREGGTDAKGVRSYALMPPRGTDVVPLSPHPPAGLVLPEEREA